MQSPAVPSPASISSSRSTRKRDLVAASSFDSLADDLDEPPKKRAPRSTASEKAAKKSARMERNRIAAQASRDRKKNHTDFLENRIAELEAQLERSETTATPVSSCLSLHDYAAVPTQPPLGGHELETARLREENESLRTQLALEKLESRGLQLRLASLEGKFGRLEKLLENLGNQTTAPSTNHISGFSSRGFPAADVVASFSPPTCLDEPVPFGSASSAASVLPFDFSGFDNSPLFAPSATDFTSDFSLDSDLASNVNLVDAPVIDDSTLAQAWSDWSSSVPPQPVVEQDDVPFDLFDFIQREVAAGQSTAATEIVC
ncbi:uncharacterized protein JCM15063_003246 [Sporobolomyces koalae]|uniref:uncharacterized protein n=1 Tax=Sporobolomyces koalae TaxID=500713 RepID=UPI0031740E76